MTLISKSGLPVLPPYKFNELPEGHRSVLNCIFNNYIETSHVAARLGLTTHAARNALIELFDKGVLRIVVDNETSNGQIHPEDRYGLELWNHTADTFTLI